MVQSRMAERIGGVVTLAIGAAALYQVFMALGPAGCPVDGAATCWDDPSLMPLRFGAFIVGGIGCVLTSLWLWFGATSSNATARRLEAAPLFGRKAGKAPTVQTGPSAILLIAPFLVAACLVADRMQLWPQPEGAGEIAAMPEPLAPPVPADPSPPPKQPAQVEPPAPAVPIAPDEPPAIEPPANAENPPAGAPGVDPGFPELLPPPQLAEPPKLPEPGEQDAAAPPPADIAAAPPTEPPQTVAPLPKPEPLPTQPEGHRESVVYLDVSPDGATVMSASTDHSIKLWDLEGKRLIRTLGEQKDMARAALFLPDGKSAITCGDDGEIVLRSIANGAILHIFSATEHGGTNKLAISKDGKRAVSVHDAGTVIIWDLESRKVLHVMAGHDWSISGTAMSPDGRRAISGSIDGELILWDADAGKVVRKWLGHDRGTYGAVFTPDGRYAVTGSGDYSIKVWDAGDGHEVKRFDGHSGTVYALAISADGKRLLSSSLDGTARLWDFDTGKELAMFDPRTGPIHSVAFARDGSVLTGGKDRAIRRWPASGGAALALLPGAPD